MKKADMLGQVQLNTLCADTAPLQSGAAGEPLTDQQRGLSAAEAARRLAQYGANRLPEPNPPRLLITFLRQFLSPFIYILMIAAAASVVVGQMPSAIFIVAVLFLNAGIGAVQEFSAQKSAAALKALVKGYAHVLRDGKDCKIDAAEVVPGDLIFVASGDRVAADIILLATNDLGADESMLTGESLAVTKHAEARPAEDAALAERNNQLFAGSVITRGRGKGVVLATGLSTQIGKIAERVSAPRSSEPPLMIRIRRFTYQVAVIILIAIAALVGLMALVGGYTASEMLMMAIGLAVSAIPEGLPAALTVALAIGMQRMAKNNVVIRKLIAVEALGSCTFICSDKTGTLTVNELTIDRAVLPDGSTYAASGAGIAPGEVSGQDLGKLCDLIETGVLANESMLDYAGEAWVYDGDIVDVAFLVFAKKYGLSLTALREHKRRLKLIPYESERAYSASFNLEGETGSFYIKGSPEKILAASSHMKYGAQIVPLDAALISAQFEGLANKGYRVIALAQQPGAELSDEALSGLTFLGMVAMIDPVRPEARAAIARCRAGGIGVAMVTGDHPATARAIGVDLGLCTPDTEVVTGAMIRLAESRGRQALNDLVLPARIFARIEPAQKETIVETFETAGHFVAVTGDGVNDAPAMRRANAGVAMGKSGTDVAKEAADLIITDDNFASLVSGIEQGRIVYNNIRKVISLLTATGFSALLLFFFCVAAGLPMPLTAVQLLWLNLIANGVQDVALAFEPKEGDELDQKPRRPSEPIFERHLIEHVLVAGAAMGILAFGVFSYIFEQTGDQGLAQNATLMVMVLFGNIHALSSRSETRSIFSIRYLSNRFLAIATPGALGVHLISMWIPGLNSLIGLAPLPISVLGLAVLGALAFLLVEEGHKLTIRRRARSTLPAPGPGLS